VASQPSYQASLAVVWSLGKATQAVEVVRARRWADNQVPTSKHQLYVNYTSTNIGQHSLDQQIAPDRASWVNTNMRSRSQALVAQGLHRRACLGSLGRSRCATLSITSYRSSSSASRGDSINVDEILSKPSWSVSTLLPSVDSPASNTGEITAAKLQHLLRLSALPPATSEEESDMLRTLTNQLHFVRQIQSVDTDAVEPLRALRDETAAGELERTIDLDSLKDALDKEDQVGQFWKRPIRQKSNPSNSEAQQKWNALKHAKTIGNYFVVDKATQRNNG
jgi:Asp-tRNA(Asn)/Glu-tRNA(Gln) amidotransferase C subunit